MLQLLGLLLILDYESVKEPGASNLELGAVGVLLDFDALGIFPAGLHEEVLKNVKKKFEKLRIFGNLEIFDF